MNSIIEVQKKIIPQAIELMEKRYAILRQISISQPIGRRMLSVMLDISERATRTEVDFLKEQNLINITVSGMTLTDEGRDILEKLDQVMGEVMGISDLETKLSDALGIKSVSISKDISDKGEGIPKGVAVAAARYLINNLQDGEKIAIAGGTTMREVAKNVQSERTYPNALVLPTRGSLGSDIDIQANSLAALLAKNLGAKVEFLYVPDQVEGEARKTILSIPDIKKTIDHLKQVDKILFSIGRADTMAKRRGMTDEEIKSLSESGAIGEAFGYYFGKDGKVVTKLNTVGIDMDMFKNSKESILVFSGIEKVEPFLSLYKINKNISLITDEETAREILSKISNKK